MNIRILRFAGSVAAALFAGCASGAMAEGVWISHPSVASPERQKEAVSLQFRRDFHLERAPRRLEIKVSADNRYVLFVNGQRVDAGPSRGDLAHWRFRRLDIAGYLRPGDNVIAAQVWNDGEAAGAAQISARTGLWLDVAQGSDPAIAKMLESGPDWKVRIDASRRVAPAQPGLASVLGWGKYFAAPPPETHDAGLMATGWAAPAQALPDWSPASAALAAGEVPPWRLVEDRLPRIRTRPLDGGRVVMASGVRAGRFPAAPLALPANSAVTLRLDMGAMRAAYPRLVTSGGKDARIELTYAEAPYGSDLNYLANRGDATHGWILGLTDTFLPDGGPKREFSPFWWRAWRYAQLKITTGAQPLRLESFSRVETGYPFEMRARFVSDDTELNRIWQIGWDTVQIDAHETYMDTAYWEQLQYVGDTRIQALVSYAVAGDPRLAAQAIEAFAHSQHDGLIQSRWPSNTYQSIPPFALLWVGMLHDYWMRQPDPAPVRQVLGEMRSSLEWYARHVQADGLVGTTPGWEFIDWRTGLDNYPETRNPLDSEQCIVSLIYVGALQQAADIETALGEDGRATGNRDKAAKTAEAVRRLCWSADKGLFADHPKRHAYSQHANILAVLYDVAPRDQQKAILERILRPGQWPQAPEGITPATFYFDFYLARALSHAGMGDRYLDMLAPWRKLLAQNFTTWPEQPDPTRSDSHAWSSHPTFDLLETVAGIEPAAPGFGRVRITPQLGTLRSLDAAYAHPLGTIEVSYRKRRDGGLSARVTMPAGLSGEFAWGGEKRELVAGANRFRFSRDRSRRSAVMPVRPSAVHGRSDGRWDDAPSGNRRAGASPYSPPASR